MLKIKFCNEEMPRSVSLDVITPHVIQLKGPGVLNTSGFYVLSKFGSIIGDYTAYKTAYREIIDGIQLSDDGSIYTEPETIAPVEPGAAVLQNTLTLEQRVEELEIAVNQKEA